MTGPSTLRLVLATVLLSLSVGLYAAHRLGDGAPPVPDVELERIGVPPVPRSGLLEQALDRLEARLVRYPDDHEASLLKAIILFKTGARDAALSELDGLLHQIPTFHLAHLIRGDLLLAKAQPVTDIGSSRLLTRIDAVEDGLALLKQEAEARLSAYLDSMPQGRLPRPLLMLDETLSHALVVDKAAHRLYVYERDRAGIPRLVQDFYVSTGKLGGNKLLTGDLKTPEGVYYITRHIPDTELPDKYGIGAYPINYPNELDRRLGKTGYGIWLHGTETNSYARPPLDSEGCVVLPNLDLDAASEYIEPGRTPVVIAESVEWLEESAWRVAQREVLAAVEAWRSDWESLDVDRYLSHYAEGFWSGGHSLASWQARKRRVAAGKTRQSVTVDDLSLFAYPQRASGAREMVVAEFKQQYRSNNYETDLFKRLYLVREAGTWKVLYEGPAEPGMR